MENKDQPKTSYKRIIIVILICALVLFSLGSSVFFFFADQATLNEMSFNSKFSMMAWSGPMSAITIDVFPLFAFISAAACIGFAWLAIKIPSYGFTAFLFLVWYITGMSGVVYTV